MLKRGRDSWGRKGRVVLGDALTFQPSKTSHVGQGSFTLPLKHQLPEGRQGLFLTPKGLEEELWMLAGDRQGNGSLPCGHEAGVQYQSLWKGGRCPFSHLFECCMHFFLQSEPRSPIRRTCMEKFIPVSGKGKKNICSHHQSGNLSQ